MDFARFPGADAEVSKRCYVHRQQWRWMDVSDLHRTGIFDAGYKACPDYRSPAGQFALYRNRLLTVRQMAQKRGDPDDWQTIILFACLSVRNYARRGCHRQHIHAHADGIINRVRNRGGRRDDRHFSHSAHAVGMSGLGTSTIMVSIIGKSRATGIR